MNTSETICTVIYTTLGVLLGIRAAIGGVRLDWAECALVVGVVLVTVGTIKLISSMKGGNHNEFV